MRYQTVSVPGRVNLIGEHIDYHNLPVLPIAIQKQIRIAYRIRSDKCIRAISREAPGVVNFPLNSQFTSAAPGDWSNYVRAAAAAVRSARAIANGIDALVASDLPMAAGLSSSSALLIAFSLALLDANGIKMTLQELTALLPDAEQLVGTRGGAMDHVAILASRACFATLIKSFAPPEIEYVSIPENWRLLIAHSLVNAEKSGAVRSEYNARRFAGSRAIEKLGFASYRDALRHVPDNAPVRLTDRAERDAFLHVTSEARRVEQATAALRRGDPVAFGRILCESHASLRDCLHVSLPEIDTLIDAALDAGAFGARLTGAGFGGCIVCLCTRDNANAIRTRLMETYYAQHAGFDAEKHIFIAEASAGALSPQTPDDSNQH